MLPSLLLVREPACMPIGQFAESRQIHAAGEADTIVASQPRGTESMQGDSFRTHVAGRTRSPVGLKRENCHASVRSLQS